MIRGEEEVALVFAGLGLDFVPLGEGGGDGLTGAGAGPAGAVDAVGAFEEVLAKWGEIVFGKMGVRICLDDGELATVWAGVCIWRGGWGFDRGHGR